jgi:hypothetical protein
MRWTFLLALAACAGETGLQPPETDAPAELVPIDYVDLSRDALPFATPAEARDPIAADVDGDGDLDLLGVDAGGVWLMRAFDDRFTRATSFAALPPPARLLALPDGTVLALGGAGPDHLLRDGDAPIPLPTRSARATAGDVDGDDRVDVVLWGTDAEEGPATLRWLPGRADGLGDAAPLRGAPEALPAVDALALGDTDGDGTADLLLAADGRAPLLLLGDGRGAVLRAPPERLSAEAGAGRFAAFHDVDGDRDLDLVLAGTGPIRLLRNTGSTFVDETAIAVPPTPVAAVGLAVTDADEDGHAELLVARADGPLVVLRADGRGRWFDYSDVVTSAPASARATGFTAADLDGDGDLELFLTLTDLRRPRLWTRWHPAALDDADDDRVPDALDVCPDTWDPDQGDADFEPFACAGRADCAARSGCALHWIDGAPLLRCDEARTFPAADAHCRARGARLILPASAEASASLAAHGLLDGWIDLHDGEVEGTFVDGDGAPPTWTAWADGEPNDAGGAEDCAQARGDGLWNDLPCDARLPFTCAAPAPYQASDPGDACDVCPDLLDPDQADTDGDGRGDACSP